MIKLHTIVDNRDMQVHALQVPGGLLFITETWAESSNGISVAVSSSFVPTQGYAGQDYLNKLKTD